MACYSRPRARRSIINQTSSTATVAKSLRQLLHENARPRTRWSTASRRTALAVLLTVLLALVACLISAHSTYVQQPTGDSGIVDPVVLRLIVDRVHRGENYYDAAGQELRRHGYATGSVFNWREPLYAWLLGNLPSSIWDRILLASLAVLSIAWGIVRMLSIGSYWMAIILFYPLLRTNAACFLWWGPTTIEVWAGQLIFLSVLAFGSEWWLLGVAGAVPPRCSSENLPPRTSSSALQWRSMHGDRASWLFGLSGSRLTQFTLPYTSGMFTSTCRLSIGQRRRLALLRRNQIHADANDEQSDLVAPAIVDDSHLSAAGDSRAYSL